MSTVSIECSRKLAQDGFRDKVVINLDAGSPIVGSGSQREALMIPTGTRTSPIDVEALDDERRNSKNRRRPVVVVDLELDTSKEDDCYKRLHRIGCHDAGTTFSRSSGSKRRRVPPVICLSPDREEGASFQPKNTVRVSRMRAKVAPKEPIFTCPVCLNKLEQPSTTTCGHIFCEKCIKASINAQKKCPTCRKNLGPKSYHRVYLPTTAD